MFFGPPSGSKGEKLGIKVGENIIQQLQEKWLFPFQNQPRDKILELRQIKGLFVKVKHIQTECIQKVSKKELEFLWWNI